ncbi:helix-turn-helix domain-containing protein [uncultured Parvimonas sp.]|uniref:helix-turn-helix domain-containing protein n=1 Tax=uncultured Parvimonas sp. TaxID=747372 RepID=UPI0025940980|nr:helix-turn-helix transcriptional regulator [uncultured Parvimonas sp.]
MKINIDKKAVGQRIKNIRLEKGLNLEEFARLFNTDNSNSVRWEKGKTTPTINKIKTISKIGNISINELLYGSITEIIENNIDLICKELGINLLDFLGLYNDVGELISEDINITSDTVFYDIIRYFKKSIEDLKKEYLDNIKRTLNIENLQYNLDNIFLSQTIGNEKYKQITTIEDLKNFYNLYIDNLSIVDIYDNMIDLLNFNEEIYKNRKNLTIELIDNFLYQKKIIEDIKKILTNNTDIKKENMEIIKNKLKEVGEVNNQLIQKVEKNEELKTVLKQIEELEEQEEK